MTEPLAPQGGTPPPAAGLTRGGLLARNAIWSLLGQVVPMLAAAVAIPVLLHGLGNEAFGVLTLSWTLIGYFTLFDLGLGRALTRLVAERLGSGETGDLPTLVGTSVVMLAGFGVAGGGLLALLTPWLVGTVLHVPAILAYETRITFYLLAGSLPAVLVTAGLGGVLAAYQRFRAMNLIRIPMSILSFVLPMLVLPLTSRLSVIVGTIVVVRFVGAVAHLVVCRSAMPGLQREFRWTPRHAGPLLLSGGWLAVVNVMVPLFASADRLVVGALTSVAVVAYYATPQELATKLWILPGTLVSVLFPALAANRTVDPERVRTLFLRGLTQVYIVLFPVTLVLVVLGADILRLWLGAGFEREGQAALRYLTVGALCTGLSFIPSALIQAVGQPRRVGLLLLAEVPFFAVLLVWGVRAEGITGAALAWCIRALVDLVALMIMAAPDLVRGRTLLRELAIPACFTVLVVVGSFAAVPQPLGLRLGALAIVLLPFGAWAFTTGLARERDALRAGLAGR